MVIRQPRPSVKGTTRVSFNDRQLVRKLYSADKNSRQSRQKRTRELSKADRDLLAQAPHRRARDAFKKWLKKVRQRDSLFDMRDTDERASVQAMCDSQWDLLLLRRGRLQSLATAYRRANKRCKTSAPASALMTKIAANLATVADRDVPLLSGRRQHIRAANYRRKVQCRADLFANIPRFKQSQKAVARRSNCRKRSLSARDAQLFELHRSCNLCEPLPRCDYEDCDENVFYVCHRCNDPVQATRMLVEHNGAFDAFFFHSRCYFDDQGEIGSIKQSSDCV